MGRLANIGSRDVERVARQLGWEFKHQTGSHRIFDRPFVAKTLSIPEAREIPQGTLRGLIRDMGISVDEFLRLKR